MRFGLLLLVLLAAACDRAALEVAGEDGPIATEAGLFEADAGLLSGGGYERLEGAATFSFVETPGAPAVLFVRLRSIFEGTVLPDSTIRDTSYVDFALGGATLPERGRYAFVDVAELDAAPDTAFVACYRSLAFPDGAYRSATGTIEIVSSGERLIGTFDVEVYADRRTGPATFERRTLPIAGRFDALAEPADTLDAAALFRCGA